MTDSTSVLALADTAGAGGAGAGAGAGEGFGGGGPFSTVPGGPFVTLSPNGPGDASGTGTSAVPEPGSLLFVGAALAAMGAHRLRRR